MGQKPKISLEWKIKADKQYGQMYHPHRDLIPKRNKIPLCGSYHIKGWCYANFPYDHDSDDRNIPIFTRMNMFCQRFRKSGF